MKNNINNYYYRKPANSTFFEGLGNNHISNIKIFWIGFTIYYSGFFLAQVIEGQNKIVIVQLIGLILIFFSVPKIIYYKFHNPYLKTVFTFYLFWLFLTIIRAGEELSDYYFWRNFFLDAQYGGILYLTPLALLLPKRISFYKIVFKFIFVFSIIYLIFSGIFLTELLNSDRESIDSQGIIEHISELSFPLGFALLTLNYHNNKKKFLTITVLLLTIAFSLYRGRRGLVLMFSNIVVLSLILQLFYTKYKFFFIYTFIVLSLLSSLYISKIYKINENPLLGYIVQRGKTNTRETVELYFFADMNIKDWIIGRGINGEYFCTGVDDYQTTDMRSTIETGYLHNILKGGIINIVLFLLIAVPAMLKGLFFSKNISSKAAALWIAMALINLYPAPVTKFSFQYILVWISIGICYSKEIRNIPEKLMADNFHTNASTFNS